MAIIVKRIFDFVIALMALVIFSPILLLICIILWFYQGLPIFFTQPRIGKNNEEFLMIKFRTMNNKKDQNGQLLPDIQRVSPIGLFLRKSSLDELPELLNVLIGNMSLVGPRPLLTRYLAYYTKRELQRHNMMPGITGLAQINGRNLLHWDERLELDVVYTETFSLWLDCKILFKTIKQVIYRKDVIGVSSTVMPDFDDYRRAHTSNSDKKDI